MEPRTVQFPMQEWKRHRKAIESLYNEAQSVRYDSRRLDHGELSIMVRDALASGKLEAPQLSRALSIIQRDTGRSEQEPGKPTVELSLLSAEALRELYNLVACAIPDLQSKEEKWQRARSLEYVRTEMRVQHGLEASISHFEAQLGDWGLLGPPKGTEATNNTPLTPPSPAQAGLRDDPDWIVVSTLSGLGLPKHNNISFRDESLGDWSSLPYGRLEERLCSKGIDLHSQGPVLEGLSREIIASSSALSSKDQSIVWQAGRRQDQLEALANFLPVQNATLITGDQIFETNFLRVLVFSMLNGFAGLSDIPMDKILKFLGRLVVHSVFLRILEESPTHTSRTLSDNIFRAAIEAKDEKVVKMLLHRRLVEVNDIVCIQNDHKYTPIQRAARLGALGLVRALAALGADVNKMYPARYHGENIISMLITAASPRDFSRNMRFRGGVTAAPDLMETFEVLIKAGAKVSWRNVMEASGAFTTYDLALRLSLCIDPAVHRDFFGAHYMGGGTLRGVGEFSDDGSATKLVLHMIDLCNQAGCGKCLAKAGHTLKVAVIGGAKRGHVNLVKLLIDHVDQHNDMHEILAAAIISREKDLIDLVLSRDPELNPPAFTLDNFAGTLATTPIAEAVRVGDEELIKYFEAAGALGELAEGGRFESLLLAAIEAGNVPYVKSLIGRATTSKQSYRDNGLALTEAIHLGHEEIAWILLDAGFGANQEPNQKHSPLGAAMKRRDPKLVYAILDAGPARGFSGDVTRAAIGWCDPSILCDLMDTFFDSLFFYGGDLPALCKRCIETGNVQFFRHFIENLGGIETSNLNECLMLAIEQNGETDMIQQLLDMGADPFAAGPLQAAIAHQPGILQRLCAKVGEPPRVRRKCIGASTLKHVMGDVPGNAETLETLLETQAVNLTAPQWLILDVQGSRHGRGGMVTPLGLAIEGVPEHPTTDPLGFPYDKHGAAKPCGPNIQAARRFLQAGSDPNGIAKAGGRGRNQSPLMLAVKVGRADIVELLIRHGADVNQQPTFHTWRSPLQYAAELASLDMVRLLLNHGADVNGAPHVRGGGTALQFAAITGSCPLAAELLLHGALLDALPSRVDGRWPLEAAAEHGRLDMIRFLWDVNARAQAKGVYHDGFTERHCLRAMYFARENGHIGCQALIEELSGTEAGQLDTDEYGAPWLAY